MKAIKLSIPAEACKACIDNVLMAFNDCNGVAEVYYLAETAILVILDEEASGQTVADEVEQKLDGSAPDFNMSDCQIVDLASIDHQLKAATKYTASLFMSEPRQ